MRGAVVDLYGAAASARAAGLGTVHLGKWLSRNCALRRSLQLVPVPGKLLRPCALRVDARQLEFAAQRQDGPLRQQAPQAQIRGIRLWVHLQTGARGFRRAESVLDGGSARAVAERLLPRQSFRMAGTGGRREHAQRRLVFHAGAEGARTLYPAECADLGEPDQRRARPLDHEPRHQPRHRRLGGPGPHRRPHQGTRRPERPRERDDPQAPVRGSRGPRARPRSEGDHSQSEYRQMRGAALLPEKGERGWYRARGVRQISAAERAPQGISALLRPTPRGPPRVRTGHGYREPLTGAAPALRASRIAANVTALSLSAALGLKSACQPHLNAWLRSAPG